MNRSQLATPLCEGFDLGLPHPLHLHRALTQSDHYHFGFFPELAGDAPAVDLRAGMDRMALLPLRSIPKGSRILDVGSGMGGAARLMASRGFDVTAVEPDRALVAYSMGRLNHVKGPEFHAKSLEAFVEANPLLRFDVLVLTEVLQHFPGLDELFQAAHLLLRPGGKMIFHDLTISPETQPVVGPFHQLEAILEASRVSGFELDHKEDLTRHVRPSLEQLMRSQQDGDGGLIAAFGPTRPRIRSEIEEFFTQLQNLAMAIDAGDLVYNGVTLRKGPTHSTR